MLKHLISLVQHYTMQNKWVFIFYVLYKYANTYTFRCKNFLDAMVQTKCLIYGSIILYVLSMRKTNFDFRFRKYIEQT